nr:MAG TPA: hypothetical protein [Caudoviricetes sp.]
MEFEWSNFYSIRTPSRFSISDCDSSQRNA